MHETIDEAIQEVVRACGGNKQIGARLWPELPLEQAGNKLRDCLNPDRREKLSPEQVVFLLRLGREHGAHAGLAFICHDCGYAEPQPLQSEDERARLQREYIEAAHKLSDMAERIELLSLYESTRQGRD